MKVFSEEKQSRPIPSATQGLTRAHRLRLAFLPPLLICLLPPPLAADCQVELATGAIVTCTGVDTDGIVTGALNDTVIVASGATVSTNDTQSTEVSASTSAITLATDGGDEVMTNNATISANASADVGGFDLIISHGGTGAYYDGVNAGATATGIDSGTNITKDIIVNNGIVGNIQASAIIGAGQLQLDLVDLADSDSNLTAEATATGIHAGGSSEITNNGTITVNSKAAVTAGTGEVNIADWGKAKTTVIPVATSLGINGGSGFDTITNSGTVAVSAATDASIPIVEVNVVDLAIGGAGIGIGPTFGENNPTVVTDPGTPMEALAVGIDAGDGGSEMINTSTGMITATAHASANIENIVLTVFDFTIASDFRNRGNSIATFVEASATGIKGGDGIDSVTNDGQITATAIPYVVSFGLGAGAEGVPSGSFSNTSDFYSPLITPATADVTAMAKATGIATGAGNDTIVNAGTIVAHAGPTNLDPTVTSAGLSLSVPLLELSGLTDWLGTKPSMFVDWPPAIAVLSAGSSAQAIAMGIDAGEGNDRIVNSLSPVGAVTVNARSLATSDDFAGTFQNVGKEGGGTGWSMNFDLALAKATTLASAAATGLAGDEGNDVIENWGQLDVNADAEAWGTAVSVSASLLHGMDQKKKGLELFGGSGALTNLMTKAEAMATGIVGGTGNDTVYNFGQTDVDVDAFANSLTAAVSFQGEIKGLSGGVTFADTSTTSTATATGIAGGDGEDHIYSGTDGNGTDRLHAYADAEAYAETLTVTVQAGSKGVEVGGALALGSVTATATATGIDGGTGSDTLSNVVSGFTDVRAEATANNLSATVDVQSSVKGLGIGVALTDSTTLTTAAATGMFAGDGDDYIAVNLLSTLQTYADSEAYAESFSVTVQGESTGLALGGALALGSTTADATAFGIDGGFGNDKIQNAGTVDVNTEAITNNLAIGVDVQATVKGLGVGVVFTDASSTGTATAAGLVGGTGNDALRNNASGTINVHADAEAYAELFSVAVQATSSGVALGGALALADSRATSTASGMDGGVGRDSLINAGMTEVNAEATANSLAVSATIQAEVVGLGAQVAFTDTSTFSTTTALGMTGGADRDTLTNQNGALLKTDATAKAYSESISVSMQGESTGVTLAGALARAGTTPTATSTGFSGGAGNDHLYNYGLTDVSAVTDSTSVAVGVRAVGIIKGVSVGASLTDTSTTATAIAMGMDGGLGNDIIQNTGTIDTDTDSTLRAASISFDYGGIPIGVSVGAALAKADTNATGYATGINGGFGDDTITNAGGALIDVDTTARTTSTAVAISANVLGAAWVDTSTTTTIKAVGIDGGDGANMVTNRGQVLVDTNATGNASSYSINIGMGGSSAKAGTEAIASSFGLVAGSDNDTFNNYGEISLLAQSTLSAESVSFTLSGFSSAQADSTAVSNAIGIDAGDGVNTVTNWTGGVIAAKSLATATAEEVSVTIGVAGVDGSTTATAQVAGIQTGSGNDFLYNYGSIQAGSKVSTTTVGGKLDLAGVSALDSTPGALVEGIVSGDGNDYILNAGSITIAGLKNDPVSEDWTVGGVGASPLAYAAIGTVDFLSLFNFSTTQFSAKAQTAGIRAGGGNDTIINRGLIEVGGTGWMTEGVAAGFAFQGISFFDIVSVGARAQTISLGIDGGDGNDIITNELSGQVTVKATSHASATGSAEAIFFGSTAAFGTSTALAESRGIDGGRGGDVIYNKDGINATSDAWADVNAVAWVGWGTPAAYATANATSWTAGVDAGEGRDAVANTGQIEASASSKATSNATADSDVASNNSEAKAYSNASAFGVKIGDDGGDTFNGANHAVTVHATAFGLSTSISDESADALAVFNADAIGIHGGSGNNVTENWGEISVTSSTASTGPDDWDAHALASSNSTAKATATAKRGGSATAMGISMGHGNNWIGNEGEITVTATNTAKAKANYPDAHLNDAYSCVGAGDCSNAGNVTLLAYAAGIAVGNGNNTLLSHGEITVNSILNATAESYSDTLSEANAARAYAGGTVLATGISVGNGANHIDLLGDLTVTATVTATAYGSGENFGEGYVGSADAAGVIADARGVVVGNGNNTIVNTATLHVTAQSTASSSGITDDDDDFSAAVANAQAKAYGMVTGNGNNALINFGTIDVNAESLATVVSTTFNQQAYSSALAIGIQTGSGNEVVANYGTITTSQIMQQGTASRGIALDTAAGNDWTILGAYSATMGDILLGTGDDTLMFLGSAIVEGAIDPGSGSNSLVFDGVGRLDLPFNGFENTTKQGAGTFTLASLPTMHRLEVTQGTLRLESSYAMAGDSLFRTVINSNGSHGQLAVEGTATLDGALNVTKGPGFFFNGTTFDILTADSVQDHFTSVQLPAPKKLLRFGLRQSDERVQVVTQALPFTAAASNPVEWAVSNYLDRIVHRASGDLYAILAEIQNLEDTEFPPAFRSLSPASYGAFTAASLMGTKHSLQSVQQRMSTVRAHSLIAGSLKESEPVHLASIGPYENMRLFATEADSEMRTDQDLWASGLGQWGSQDDQPGYPGYEYNIATGTIGYDHTFPSRITLGAALSKGTVDVDLADNTGEGTIDSLSGILYGSYFSGRGYVEGALSYGRNAYENSRSLTIGSIRRTATSEHDGDVYSAYLGGGYFLQTGDWLVGPTAALRYAYLDEEGFAERGAGSVNLVLNDHQTQSLVSELSLQATTAVKTSRGALIPEVSAGVSYDFDLDDRVITAGFEGASGTVFSIEDQDTEQFGAVVGCGLTLMGDNGLSTSVQYRGEFRGDFQSHGVMGVLRFTF